MALNQTLLDALVEIGFTAADIEAFESVLNDYYYRVANEELALRRGQDDADQRYAAISAKEATAKSVAQKLEMSWPEVEPPIVIDPTSPPPPPPPPDIIDPPPQEVPLFITRRQGALQLLTIGMITSPEAIAMTQSGTPPASIQAYIDTMPEPDRTHALIDFAATSYFRNNPLLNALMLANGMTNEQVDQFFISAAML